LKEVSTYSKSTHKLQQIIKYNYGCQDFCLSRFGSFNRTLARAGNVYNWLAVHWALHSSHGG